MAVGWQKNMKTIGEQRIKIQGGKMYRACVYFRCYNQISPKNALFSACFNVLKNQNASVSSHDITSTANNSLERIRKISRCMWLWNPRNAHQNKHQKGFNFPYYLMLIPVAVKRFFGYEDEDEQDPKAVLVNTIKRSILLIQRGEKEKAEQMLHIALKMAQDQRSDEGVTYVYDVMANLAFDNDEFDKSEQLFVSLLQRLLARGMQQNDNKFIHINLKLAKVYQYSKRPDQSEIGYKYCLDALEKKLPTNKDDEDTVMLWCLTLDWYGRFLLEQGKNKAALGYLNRAYDTLVQFGGETHPQLVLLLNDMGIVHSMLDDEAIAAECFEKALKLGKDLDDPLVPNVMINMGLLYLRKLKLDAANTWCTQGRESAIRLQDPVSKAEASDCLTAIKDAMKTTKS